MTNRSSIILMIMNSMHSYATCGVLIRERFLEKLSLFSTTLRHVYSIAHLLFFRRCILARKYVAADKLFVTKLIFS
jgi:hypothetical protein